MSPLPLLFFVAAAAPVASAGVCVFGSAVVDGDNHFLTGNTSDVLSGDCTLKGSVIVHGCSVLGEGARFNITDGTGKCALDARTGGGRQRRLSNTQAGGTPQGGTNSGGTPQGGTNSAAPHKVVQIQAAPHKVVQIQAALHKVVQIQALSVHQRVVQNLLLALRCCCNACSRWTR